jgi:ribosomal protein L37E
MRAHNSLITLKQKICKRCGNPSYIFSHGRCKLCATIEYTLAKDKKELNESNGELEDWFKERREEMTGICSNCGNPSSKKNDKFYKCSIAHILPKAYFPSVDTHPDNWIELCFWGDNSCHTNMDNQLLDMSEMNCWNEIIIKFQKIYPSIASIERRRIPSILLQQNYFNTLRYLMGGKIKLLK